MVWGTCADAVSGVEFRCLRVDCDIKLVQCVRERCESPTSSKGISVGWDNYKRNRLRLYTPGRQDVDAIQMLFKWVPVTTTGTE